MSITPIPVDRPPFPLPAGVAAPVYFTIQSPSRGGRKGRRAAASLAEASAKAGRAARI